MIDNKTENKNYPLPHPKNIASQDVGRIATAIEMIDADVNACSVALYEIQETVQELDAKSLRIPSSLVGTVNTELSDLEPRRYIVVNNDATGFSTVEGGGGEGGLIGEVLAKRSNFNFDTMWVDPRAIMKKAAIVNEVDDDFVLKNNNAVILTDDIEIDNSDQLPRVGLTQRQILADAIADSQYTYILCDAIDESAPDESDIATATKFGRVMIGDGIDDDNGKISVPAQPKASKTNYGIVKIGPGLDVDDGVVSAPNYQQADHENYGTIQGSNDDETWTDLTYELASWSQKEAKIFYWFNETSYLYYRLLIESVQSGTNAGLAKFSLGTQVEIPSRCVIECFPVVLRLPFVGGSGWSCARASSSSDACKRNKLFERQDSVKCKSKALTEPAAQSPPNITGTLRCYLSRGRSESSFLIACRDKLPHSCPRTL